MVPRSASSYGILASFSLVTMAAASSSFRLANATWYSDGRDMVMKPTRTTTAVMAIMPSVMRWLRLRLCHMPRASRGAGRAASIVRPYAVLA